MERRGEMLELRFKFACCIVAMAAALGLTTSAQVVDLQRRPAQPKAANRTEIPPFPNILYGAAYYNEYMAGDQAARLDKDVALMKAAGLNVVRMGESTWSLWEPEDGRFDYAWMDRVVDAMGKAGIKVILGTPTYSIPAWMARKHPEILAQRLNECMYGGPPLQNTYGMRQNMDTDAPAYRFYAERLIRHIVAHYKDNPNVIGWQLDNETSSYDADNADVFAGFRQYLEKKFVTPEALSKAWFLNYWGENIHSWEDLPRREGAQSTGYKLEWIRWSQMRVTDFLGWQARLVRSCAAPRQFVTTDFAGAMHRDVDENAIASFLDIPAVNNYHGTQDHFDGASHAEAENDARHREANRVNSQCSLALRTRSNRTIDGIFDRILINLSDKLILNDDLAPQVGLEPSRLIQPLAQIHIDFVTNIGKSKGYVTSSLQPTTSSEIAKIARIGSPAVQKQYIFRPTISNFKLVWLTVRCVDSVHPYSLQGTALSALNCPQLY